MNAEKRDMALHKQVCYPCSRVPHCIKDVPCSTVSWCVYRPELQESLFRSSPMAVPSVLTEMHARRCCFPSGFDQIVHWHQTVTRALWMADANFDAQRGVQLSGWLKLHGAGTPKGASHLRITATAKVSWSVRSAGLTWSCGHGVPIDIRAPYEPCLVCRL